MLTKEAIMEFNKIYKEEFGEELPMDQATEKATLVLNLFKVLIYDDKTLTNNTKGDHYEN